jgi:hypothetical protein
MTQIPCIHNIPATLNGPASISRFVLQQYKNVLSVTPASEITMLKTNVLQRRALGPEESGEQL